MTCSVIIPTIRQSQVLTLTLDSLGAQSEGNFEVVVVCDGEDPQTRALSKAYSANHPLQWIFLPENRGLPSARNAGVLAAKGEILLFLDDDTSGAHDLVYQHRRHHESRSVEDTIVVYGALVYRYSRAPHNYTDRFLRMDGERSDAAIEAYLTYPGFNSIEVDHQYRSIGTNCSIRRAAFLKFGGFDPGLRRGEDFELGSRLYDGGVQSIFEPRAIGYHHETKDLSQHFRQTAEVTGRMDVYRALRKGQRDAQTRGLIAVQHRSLLRSLKMYWYWYRPGTVRGIAKIARKLTDATGSRFSFEVWRRAELAAGYWQGVKSEGLTLGDLGRLVGEPLPVLAFPNVSLAHNPAEKRHTLSPKRFERLMRILRKLGYASVGPAEGLSHGMDRHQMVLTFDGCEDFYSGVFPHVPTFSLKPVVFLAAKCLGSSCDKQTGTLARKWLSVEQIREMHRHDVQFGSLGLTHAWLPHLPEGDLQREAVESKARLEELLGSEVTCFAYPGGGVDARVRAAVARAGYKFGFTTREGLNLWEDPLCLRRMKVTNRDTTLGVAVRLATGRSVQQTLSEVLGRILQGQSTSSRVFAPKIAERQRRGICVPD